MSTRNHLYLRAMMARLGLQRGDVARLMEVEARTVSHWLSGRNGIPEPLWGKLATVDARILASVQDIVQRWTGDGRPKTYTITIPLRTPQGPHFVAAWEALERFRKAGVHVTLKRPVTKGTK